MFLARRLLLSFRTTQRHLSTAPIMADQASEEFKSWIQQKLTALYESPEDELDQAFESTFAPEDQLSLTINDKPTSRDELKKTLVGMRHTARGVSTQFHKLEEAGSSGKVRSHWTHFRETSR